MISKDSVKKFQGYSLDYDVVLAIEEQQGLFPSKSAFVNNILRKVLGLPYLETYGMGEVDNELNYKQE